MVNVDAIPRTAFFVERIFRQRAIVALLLMAMFAIGGSAFAASRPSENPSKDEQEAEWTVGIRKLRSDLKAGAVEDFRRLDHSIEPAPKSGQVLILFVDGSRLFGRDVQLHDENLQVTVDGSIDPGQFSFEIGFVRGIVALTSGSEATATSDAQIRRIESGKTPADVARLVGGDQISGELLSIKADTVTIKTSAGSIEIARPRVESIQCNSELLNPSTGSRDHAAVVLADGSLLAGTLASLGDSSIRFATNGATLEIPFDQVRSLTICGWNVVRLDTLASAKVAHTPFLPTTEPGIELETAFRTDRHVEGGLLNLGGRTFTHGLGVPSGVTLTYAIPPEAKTFHATIGIDDSADSAGSAVVEIQMDRRPAWTSPILRGGSPAINVSVDVRSGKELTLTIGFAGDGDVLDRVDLAEPVFLLNR